MAEEKPVHEQVQDLLQGWNPAPTDDALQMLVGGTPPEGDTRATTHVRRTELDHDRNPGRDDIDAQRLGAYTDDGDDNSLVYGDDLDDLSKSDLQTQAEARDLSTSGTKDEIKARIVDHDESDDDEDDEDDES